MRKKSVSLLLAFTIIFTSVGLPVFSETLTSDFGAETVSSQTQTEEVVSAISSDEEMAPTVSPNTNVEVTETELPDTDNLDASPDVSPKADDKAEIKNDESVVLFGDAVDLTSQLTAGAVTIDANGKYAVTSLTTTNNIVIKTGVSAELTLTDVSITSTNAAPIKVESGASLTLHISGENTLTAPSYYAGIAVYANDTTSDYGTLIIDGDGILNANGGTTHGAGIGTNRSGKDSSTGITGKIIINGGTINAKGGKGGAGIGSSFPNPTSLKFVLGAIEINGGIITAVGGNQAAGIGGTAGISNGNITINGGYINATSASITAYGIGPGASGTADAAGAVVINGGSVDAVVSTMCPPTDKFGASVKQIMLSMPASADAANKEVTVGSWTAVTDESGNLYPYVTDNTTSFALQYDGKIYYVADINAETTEYTLIEYDGAPCICTEGNSSATLDMPDSITVNKLAGQATEKLVSTFHPVDGCTYPIHAASAEYELTIDGAAADNTLAQISDNHLVVYYAAADKILHLKTTVTMDGKLYTDEKDITVIGDNASRFDISKGSVTITANSGDSSLMNVTHGTTQYTLSNTTTVYIEQSAQKTENTITVKGVDARVAIKDMNINTLSENPLTIGDGVNNLTLELIGDNTIYAQNTSAIQGILATSTLTIEGNGTLDIKSGVGAGIGNIKTLTVNGGTITATGGNGGAGIGGGMDGAGIEVIINNGRVFAYGNGNGAGIGGGESTSAGGGGSFTINGGMVVAESGGAGSGIGYGGKKSAPGTININGGSVNAVLAVRPTASSKNQYLVTTNLEGISGQTDVTYTIGDDDSNPIPTSTDENGKLYLYMNTGKQWIRVYKDGITYYRYMTVVANDNNAATCISNPVARLKTFEIAGQIGETVIDNDNLTVNVTVPYNIMLNKIAPMATYDGSEVTTGNLNFNNDEHTATYTVYSDDKQSKEYTVKLTLANEPATPQADTYDISKGNIVIMGDYVRYGGTYYNPNSLGYIITGTTTENNLSIDYAEQALPPITLNNLNITSASQAAPFKVNVSADVTVEGVCNITSVSTKAIEVNNTYDATDGIALNITGGGRLNIKSGISSPAVSLGTATSMSITGVATSIIGGTGYNALDGEGKFITDSETVMYITATENPVIQPKTADATPLYQLTAYIEAADKSATTCTYNDKSYYVGDDATLYLMVPNNEYSMSVNYDNNIYEGTVTVENAPAEVTLYTTAVSNVAYDNTPLSYQGGTVDFTVTGTYVANNVIIRLKPNDETFSVLEQTVKEVDGVNKASITLPENQSYEKSVTYTVYYVIKGKETELTKKILVNKNDTVCRITGFKLTGQIGDTNIYESEEYNTITVYMPYDHVFETQKYYTPSEITFIGGKVSPEAEVPTLFTQDISGYMRAKYTVTAKDNTTTSDYTVKVYKNPTPQIKSLSFSNPTSPNGGKVTVTARGTSTNYIQYAENETNRNVYIYSDDGIAPVKATMQMENGIAIYVAEIDVPANPSDTKEAVYVLKAKIGDVEQTSINSSLATVKVPRQDRALTGIRSFTIENQLGETDINGTNINITMPYDADITSILPSIILDDVYASYLPMTEQDFTNDVKYTVTAENGVVKTEYTVHVQKQGTPVATDIEFTNPRYSSAGRVQVKLNGQYLDNAVDAINSPKTIEVKGTLTSGDTTKSAITSAYASKNEDGDYIATIIVPQNNSDAIRTYDLSVIIGNTVQTLSGNVTLTVPAKEANSKDLSDIILVDGQSALTFAGGENGQYRVYLYVPYNTDLNNITPQIFHTGVSCTPDGAQNFNNTVTYTVTAQDDTYNTYEIIAQRSGAPKIDSLTMNKPAIFNDTEITLDITGQFVPYLTEGVEKDVMEISAVPRDGSAAVEGTVEYDSSVYGGHATGHITLPDNMSCTDDKIYDVKITINDVEQTIGLSGIITVPRRKARTITDFRVNGQIGSTQITEDDVNGNTIWFTMPYNTDLTSLLPRVTIDGDSYTPTDAQNFESGKSDEIKSVTYTVSAEGDTDRTYTARVLRDGLPSISSVQVSNTPTTFKGTTVGVDVTGVFFYNMKVKAVSADGNEEIEGTVTMDEWHHATATIDIPTNYDTTADKEYKLVFHLDNFENEIIYSSPVKITVPRRKTRAITNFTITNQVGVATITDTNIYVQVEYNTNLRELSSTVTIDGDSYTPTGIQNFDNETQSLVYTVSAADDEDRNYTVHVSRDGKPTISKLTFLSPINFRGGSVVVNFEGIFFETAEVSVVPVDGGAEIAGTITSFNEGKATGVVNIPTNYDTENEKVYQLKFVIDGMITSYIGGTEITVPRRTTREITEFSLPDIQEGDTKIEGTSIYIDVPYHLDIKSVTPEFTYDADSITPEGAQNFSDLDNPVKYTLSSSGDDAATYTVYITRIGNDPYLKSMTVENQAKETEYLEDTINIVLKSNAKIKEVEPILDFDGMDYTPRGPQDFSSSKKEPLVYTVFNKYGIEHKYYVTITKKSSGGGGSSSVKSTPKPTPTPTLEPTIEPTIEPTLEPTDEPSVTPAPTPTAQPKTKPYIKGYDEDGVMYFRPDNTITRAEIATILSLLDEDFNADTLYQDVFPDIAENAWYRNYMNFAIGKGYISGYDDGTSRPDNMITRAEFASMIARCMNISPADGEDRFSDIAEFDWCRQQINALADMGIVSGYDGGMFLPDNLISRAETVAMINRMLGREMTEEILERINCPFDDITSAHWAYNDVLLASCEY